MDTEKKSDKRGCINFARQNPDEKENKYHIQKMKYKIVNMIWEGIESKKPVFNGKGQACQGLVHANVIVGKKFFYALERKTLYICIIDNLWVIVPVGKIIMQGIGINSCSQNNYEKQVIKDFPVKIIFL
jgi:hypothetical protein